MTISIIQDTGAVQDVHPPATFSTASATFSSLPTTGNLLVLIAASQGGGGANAADIIPPAGWDLRQTLHGSVGPNNPSLMVATKVACPGEGQTATVTFYDYTFSVAGSAKRTIVQMFEVSGGYGGSITPRRDGFGDSPGSGTSHPFDSITPTGGAEALILASMVNENAYGVVSGPGGGYSLLRSNTANDGASDTLNTYSQHVGSASGSYSPGTIGYASSCVASSVQIWFKAAFDSAPCLVASPVADFTADTTTPLVGQTVSFTDLSTGTPTSWAWDFGDGGTSTSQNPTHAYTLPGVYSVSLTATNAYGTDTETKIAFVTVTTDVIDVVPPAGVLLEIYASDPGSARWDVAKWDVDSWGAAGWQDVTPYGVRVNITWGASRGDQGILTVPSAASWTVDYFDPDRILDPSNADGPYFGDLKPFLPIRVSHRETIIRVGFATGISHTFAKSARNGYMRGADNITRLANAQVPPDTTLSDTLYARAVDAIAAAGLSVSVAAPIGTDPPVSPWVTGAHEWSVWDWIKDAAQEVLHIPIIDRLGTVTFRPWAEPLARGRTLNSPELIDMQDVTDYSGMYSVVRAVDGADVYTERRLTPAPDYGTRTYSRNEPTLDPGGWADAVLADRALPGLLWVPGDVYPLTADSTELYATIEAVELVSMSLPEQSPPVFASGIIVGGEIDIIGRAQDQQGVWRFAFQTAQTATEPLIETGGGATDYLLRTGGGEYLYPTGSA